MWDVTCFLDHVHCLLFPESNANRDQSLGVGWAAGLTLNQLPLVLDDLLAEPPVLLAALDHEVLLAQQVLPAQAVGLQCRVLHLQLAGPASSRSASRCPC